MAKFALFIIAITGLVVLLRRLSKAIRGLSAELRQLVREFQRWGKVLKPFFKHKAIR
jgi:hypothetical protein